MDDGDLCSILLLRAAHLCLLGARNLTGLGRTRSCNGSSVRICRECSKDGTELRREECAHFFFVA